MPARHSEVGCLLSFQPANTSHTRLHFQGLPRRAGG